MASGVITRAVIVADDSAAPEADEVVDALRRVADPECVIVELIDAPIRSMLTELGRMLRASGPDDVTLLLFCGDVTRGVDDHLYFTCVADEPTPMTAVLVDVLIEMLSTAQSSVVAVFDCVLDANRDEFLRDPMRVLERGLGPSGVSVLIADASSEGVGAVAGLLAEGLRSRVADRDDDGVITVGELFEYVQRRAGALGMPEDAIVASVRRAGTPLALLDRASGGGSTLPAREPASGGVALAPVALAPVVVETPSPPRAAPAKAVPPSSTPAVPRRRPVRVLAAVGVVTVVGLAVFGGIARTIGDDDDKPRPRVTPPTAPSAFSAQGTVELPKTCTNVPAQFEITVDATKVPADLAMTATLRVDAGQAATSPLVRQSDPSAGTGLYTAKVGPFPTPGTLHWQLILTTPVETKRVSMRCGGALAQPSP
jgi:hypothetical protein